MPGLPLDDGLDGPNFEENRRNVQTLASLAEEVVAYNDAIIELQKTIMEFHRFYNTARGRHYKLCLSIFDDTRRARKQIE